MSFNGPKYAKDLPAKPGVYQMLDTLDAIIYVGKAAHLKNRVSSYFSGKAKDRKTMALVASIENMQFSITRTEGEALLLENQLIKKHKPKYNVLLKDGKSYPYIYISEGEDDFPRLEFRRGSKKGKGQYYGPFPSAQAVRHTLNHLQKVFKVRQCNNATYSHRTRPCLQHQIQRCTAPCVGLVGKNDYRQQIKFTKEFLKGNSKSLVAQLVELMNQLSKQMQFEKAAVIRDQIKELNLIQSQQVVESKTAQNLDIFSVGKNASIYIVTLCAVRSGQILGHRNFFPKTPDSTQKSEVLSSFLSQYYQDKPIPSLILANIEPNDKKSLEVAFTQMAQSQIKILDKPRADRKKMLDLNTTNMKNSLELQVQKKATWVHKWQTWIEKVGLNKSPVRVECFDISHVFGEKTRASCVVFNSKGAIKSQYRNYKITDIQAGDDYAAMRQVIEKRLSTLQKREMDLPDVFLIDGGKGQTNQALKILNQKNITSIEIIGIAKDDNRTAGEERLFILSQSRVIKPESDSLLSHMTQYIRNEAHRFAITGHRKALAKSRKKSLLQGIDGVGEKRRAILLQHFGGLQGLKKAGVEELSQLKGISPELANRIYEHLH